MIQHSGTGVCGVRMLPGAPLCPACYPAGVSTRLGASSPDCTLLGLHVHWLWGSHRPLSRQTAAGHWEKVPRVYWNEGNAGLPALLQTSFSHPECTTHKRVSHQGGGTTWCPKWFSVLHHALHKTTSPCCCLLITQAVWWAGSEWKIRICIWNMAVICIIFQSILPNSLFQILHDYIDSK